MARWYFSNCFDAFDEKQADIYSPYCIYSNIEFYFNVNNFMAKSSLK